MADDVPAEAKAPAPVTGVVEGWAAGSPPGTVLLDVAGAGRYTLFADVAELTADGERIDAAGLGTWLAGRRARVTLYPLTRFYESAARADFVTVKEGECDV